MPRLLHIFLVSILACSAGLAAGNERTVACMQPGGISWSERLAVSRIRVRQAVSLPSPAPEPPDRARAQVCVTIGAAGEVRAVSGECGDPVLLAAVLRSVPHWRFQTPTYTVTTTLTFQWRDHSAGLISERRDYPITDRDATELVRAVPFVVRELKKYPALILEIAEYPEERDGVFYLFHLYEFGKFMTFTLGWYEVNAYTGEVWDGLYFQHIRSRAVQHLREVIRQRLVNAHSDAARFEGLEPWAANVEEMMKNPCADRPRFPPIR